MRMFVRSIVTDIVAASVTTVIMLVSLNSAGAQVSQSQNYRIQSDSINFGGGLSSSDNYTLESTFGEVATGDLSGNSFNIRAGYQQMTGNYISMSAPASVVMSPSIPGLSGGEANGSTTVTVSTDSAGGYTLSIRADSNPAMASGANTIADYVPGEDPDFVFTTGSNDAHFGYSPEGSDTADRFRDDGISCNTGSGETSLACWDGLDVVDAVIARGSGPNLPSGTETVIRFRVGVGNAAMPVPGVYTATTTLTALPL